MAPEGTQSLLPAASGRIKAFLWKDDCHITWQQKFHSNSQGKLTQFAWKAAIPVWAALIPSHLSLPLAITRKTQRQSSCATSSQSWNCLWNLWNGFCAQCWAGSLPGVRSSDSTVTITGRVAKSHPGSPAGSQGQSGAGGAPEPSGCVWPGYPGPGVLGWAPSLLTAGLAQQQH